MKMKFKSLVFVCTLVMVVACSKDDNITPIPSSLISKTYEIGSLYDNVITGTAKFIKNDDNSTTVELKLKDLPVGSLLPATINYNTAAEGGSVAVTLEPVNTTTGFSTTTFFNLDDNTAITYEDLLSFDGYVDILVSSSQPSKSLAHADIGQNALNGITKTYILAEKNLPGTSGIVIFSQRKNGESLAVIQITNTINGEMHPAHIHNHTAVEGGTVAFTFNPVDGDTGISATNVAILDDSTPFLYSDISGFDGYINVHESETNIGTIISQGDIGENELTGVSKSYNLIEVDLPGVHGNAIFYERLNGEALAVILLENTTATDVHPAYMFSGEVTITGSTLFTFNPVDGETGVSRTNVSALDDDTAFGYEDVLTVDGHIKVQLSSTQPTTIVAQGNIGSN